MWPRLHTVNLGLAIGGPPGDALTPGGPLFSTRGFVCNSDGFDALLIDPEPLVNRPWTAAYLAKQRRNEKSNREAIRILKHHLVRHVYHLLGDPNSLPTTICLT